jgi:hypothetical protein
VSTRRHPACSPVSHAGYFDCPICQAPAWPSEATWLDDDRIIATYVPTCEHAGPQTMVVGGGHDHAEAGS